MSYKALVTLDLPEATKDQREIFYQTLEDEKWTKLPNLDTAWKMTFVDGVTRIGAINAIKNDLEKAKQKSKLKRVDYAIQIDVNDVIIDNL
jgi:hypothetical protein